MGTTNWPFTQRVGDKWRGWYRVGEKRVFLPLRATAEEASAEAQEMRRQVLAGGPLRAMTLGGLAVRFLEDVRRTRSAGTWDFYSVQLDGVLAVLRRETLVACITGDDMRHLIDQHIAGKFSAQTIQHRRAVLRRMFRWAIKNKLAAADPTTRVDWPRPAESTFDAIPSGDMAAHLSTILATSEVDHDLVVVTLYTGLRRRELARLRRADIDMVGRVLWVRAKTTNRYVPIVDEMVASLERMVARAGKGEFVVPESVNHRGPKTPKRPLTEAELAERRREYAIANTFRRWAKKLKDRRFHPHAMRHTLATELVRSGVERGTVGRMLRHRQAQTTDRYVHMVNADLRAAMAKLPKMRGEPQA